jgi:archaellum component FlaC
MSDLRWFGWRSLVIGSFLISGSMVLGSCGRSVDSVSGSIAPSAVIPAPSSASYVADKAQPNTRSENKVADATVAGASAPATTTMSQKPQLVKTAELSLRLESIDKMMGQLRQIVQSKQGDIYDFQDDRSQESGGHRQATWVLKVPSTALEGSLTEIAKLGRVESQGIKSEDVTTKIVDTDARLKNLRQQEDLTRKIMDRSGSVRDILAVSKELSAIREQIEQLDATVKNLRQQVAYSTINLKVEETRSANPTSDAFGVQVEETWKNSTRAAGSLGTNLALGLLWLLPFAPFIAIGGGGVYYIVRRLRRRFTVVETPQIEEG